jgi:hypothetical protein
MIPPLVRLPATVLDHDALDALARCVEKVAGGRTVLLGAQRAAGGDVLDEFVVATSMMPRCPTAAIGIAARVGDGRQASIVAREATAAQLLGACDVLVLDGDSAACHDAARVVTALFTEGVHTVTTPSAIVIGARNLPLPDVAGGLPVCWREGRDLLRLVDGDRVVCGTVVERDADTPLPAPEPGVLVDVRHRLGTPTALAAALAR